MKLLAEKDEEIRQLREQAVILERVIGEIVMSAGGRVEVPDVVRRMSPRLNVRYDRMNAVTVLEAEER